MTWGCCLLSEDKLNSYKSDPDNFFLYRKFYGMNRFNASRTGIMIPPRLVQSSIHTHTHTLTHGLPWWLSNKNSGSGRSSGEGLGNPLQYSWQENLWLRSLCKAHGVTKGWAGLEVTGHVCICAHTHTCCMHVAVKLLGCVWLLQPHAM